MTKRILAAIMAFVMIFSCMPAMHASAEEVAPASGTTYYVSSLNGAEGNDGTSESAPFASLLKINEITLQPGDRVLLERGSVFVDEYLHIQGSGSADAPIIIDAYGDESLPKPLIQTNGYGVWYQDYGKRLDNINHKYRGNVSSCILLYDVEYIEISNIAMTNEGHYADGEVYNSLTRYDRTGVAGIAENIGTVDHIYLRNLDIRNVEGHVRNKHMANGGIYLLCHLPDNQSATGISKFDDVLIEGCRLDEVNRWGIAVGYTAYWDQFTYANTIDPWVCQTYGSTNVVIRNNYLTNVGGDGITTMYCYQPVMEYNVLDGYCQDMTDEIYGPSDGQLVAAGIWPWMCKTAILQYNEAYNSTPNPDGQAWDADWGDNAIYQYNYSCNNAGGAIMFCGQWACNTVFRYNISQNDLAGVLNLASSPNGEIYNNVFYIKEGVKINRSGMSGGKGNTISNNIFYYAGSEPADATLGNWGDITADWNANLYYNYETTPDDAYAITADPLFVDPGKGPSGAQASGLVHELSAFEGYKLQSGSPAINAGVPIQDNGGKDFFGNSLDLIPDVGAHEAGTFAADASSAVLVELELGETVTITDTTGDYSDSTPVMDNEKIASVAMSGKGAVTQTTVSSTPASELVDGASYLICNAKTGSAVTNVQVDASAWSTRALQLTGNKTASAANTWTLEANGTGYKIKDSNGDYLHIELNASSLGDGDTFTAEAYGWNSWTFLNAKGFYLDNLGSLDFLGGWTEIGVASTWELYEITTSTLEGATELTFTGLFPGTTNIIIGDTLYQVRVAGDVEEVKLEVGESATFTDETGNYVGADTSVLDKNVATVELTSTATEAYTLGSKVTTMADGKYILVNTRAGKPVTNGPASNGNAKGLLFSGAKEDAANAAVWTITAVDDGYAIQDLQGKYLTVGADSAGITTAAHALDVAYNGSAWTISENNAYLNQHGGSSSTCAAGWENYAASYDAGSMWEIYQANPITAENGTQIIFTAVGGGETYVQIGQIIYHITVSGDALCLHANTELRDAVAATCTTEGYTGDTWCLDCGIKLSTGTAIPVTDHNYENGVCVGCGKTLSDVYQIATAEDLYQFRAYVAEGNLDADAVVTADITITADSGLGKWTGIGSSSKKYTGTFDGQGHTIRGLNGRGLFANVGVGGVVKNVTVADSTITGNGVGAIAGQNFGGTIDNCTVTASTIEGTKGHVGGIVGTNYGTVTRCTNDGCAVYNDECSSVGGIVGYNNNNGSDPAARNPIVSYCVNTGSVTTDYDSSERPAGGIVGENEGGLVTNCYNTGAVVSDGDAVGGIVGYANQGTIEFCHSVGSAEGDAYVGAIVGKAIHPTTVRSCYYLADAESDDQDGTTAMTAAQFASGQVTWLLNGATDQGELVWKQTLNTDAYPVFAGAVVSYDSEQDLYYNQQGGEEPDVPVENPFVDVPDDSYCFEPVLWAVEKGITTGTSEKHFSPERICTRAEVVTFLWRAAGSPEPTTTANPFVDVNESDYFYKPVLWAVENDVTNGVDDNHFNPAGTCLRAEVVTFLWRAKGSPASSTEITFTDVPAESFYANAVAWALEKGVTNGTSATTFGAAEACTRAQVVTFLYRAYK